MQSRKKRKDEEFDLKTEERKVRLDFKTKDCNVGDYCDNESVENTCKQTEKKAEFI